MTFDTPVPPRFRMPYGFGPSTGPRQGPNGAPFDWSDNPISTVVSVSFLSDAKKVAALLPPGFQLDGDPVVGLTYSDHRDIAWLAGRGYRTFGVTFPAIFESRTRRVRGPFLSILWENMPEPILTGRDELGYSKLFAELSPVMATPGKLRLQAHWDGHRFFELGLTDIQDAEVTPPPAPKTPVDGTLHYKYVPATGPSDEPDVAYACLTPTAERRETLTRVRTAKADLRFIAAAWEQMPTQHHIVSALADLPVHDLRSARIEDSVGGSDLAGQTRID